MNFTPKIKVGSVVNRTLILAVVGLIAWGSYFAPAPAPIAATQQYFRTNEAGLIVAAIEASPASGLQADRPDYYVPVSSWYKNKHWWKRNAPIVGGAGGGALVGGLIGGGTGAVVGGAVGGGGGYLYKRSRHHHHYHHYE
jgi:hypothetical protein